MDILKNAPKSRLKNFPAVKEPLNHNRNGWAVRIRPISDATAAVVSFSSFPTVFALFVLQAHSAPTVATIAAA